MSDIISALEFVKNTWREILRIFASIAGLTALIAAARNKGTFDFAQHFVADYIPIDWLIDALASINSWTSNLGDDLLQVIGGVILAIGLVGTILSSQPVSTMPRTQAPAAALIGYAFMQPAGWWPVVNWSMGAVIVAVITLLFTNSKNRKPIATHFLVGITELFISFIYVPWAIVLLIYSSSTKPSTPASSKEDALQTGGEDSGSSG